MYDIVPSDDAITLNRQKLTADILAGSCELDGREYVYSFENNVHVFTSADGRVFRSEPVGSAAADIVILDGIAFTVDAGATGITELYQSKPIADGVVKVGATEYRINKVPDGTFIFSNDQEIVFSGASGERVSIEGYDYYIIEDSVTGQISLEAVSIESSLVSKQVIEIVEEYQGIRTRGKQYRIELNERGFYDFTSGTVTVSSFEKDGTEYVKLSGDNFIVTREGDGQVSLEYLKPSLDGNTLELSQDKIAKKVADQILALDGKEYMVSIDTTGAENIYLFSRGDYSGEYSTVAVIEGKNYGITYDDGIVGLSLNAPAVDTDFDYIQIVQLADGTECYVSYDGGYLTSVDTTGYIQVALNDGTSKVAYCKESGEYSTVSMSDNVILLEGRKVYFQTVGIDTYDIAIDGVMLAEDVVAGDVVDINNIEYTLTYDISEGLNLVSVDQRSTSTVEPSLIFAGKAYLITRDSETSDYMITNGTDSYTSYRYKVRPVIGEDEEALDGDPTYSGAARTNVFNIDGITCSVDVYPDSEVYILEQLHMESERVYNPGMLTIEGITYETGYDFGQDIYIFTNVITGETFESNALRNTVRLENNVFHDIYVDPITGNISLTRQTSFVSVPEAAIEINGKIYMARRRGEVTLNFVYMPDGQTEDLDSLYPSYMLNGFNFVNIEGKIYEVITSTENSGEVIITVSELNEYLSMPVVAEATSIEIDDVHYDVETVIPAEDGGLAVYKFISTRADGITTDEYYSDTFGVLCINDNKFRIVKVEDAGITSLKVKKRFFKYTKRSSCKDQRKYIFSKL